MTGFDDVADDIVHNMLSRLPALAFASAACVNKSWNMVCTRILSRPKIASALSLNPSLHEALREVFDRVLAEPITPHFVISCIANQFDLELAHRLITERFGPRVPIVTSSSRGIIGRDALTNKMKAVQWEEIGDESRNPNARGVVIVVGFVPGLRVDAIPMLRAKMDDLETLYYSQSSGPGQVLVDKFIEDIMKYNTAVSDNQAPSLIILFGDQNINLKPLVAELDRAMPEETVIVGDTGSCFICTNADSFIHHDVVALVFARDRSTDHGVGRTEFHFALSEGIMPFGPCLRTVSVIQGYFQCSWIIATVEGSNQIIHGQHLIEDIHHELDEECHDLYIGVIHESEVQEGSSSSRKLTQTLYPVIGGDMNYVVVKGYGIKKGDILLFYHSDSETASATCERVDGQLISKFLGGQNKNKKVQKHKQQQQKQQQKQRKVFGGMVFSSYQRKQRFPGSESLDLSPFTKNFRGVPLAGFFCTSEIARGPLLNDRVDEGKGVVGSDSSTGSSFCYVQYCSTVFLAMSYLPASNESVHHL